LAPGSSPLGVKEDENAVSAHGIVVSSQGGKRSEERRRWLLCLKALGTMRREERRRGPGRVVCGRPGQHGGGGPQQGWLLGWPEELENRGAQEE
jgi:hypothetical protein